MKRHRSKAAPHHSGVQNQRYDSDVKFHTIAGVAAVAVFALFLCSACDSSKPKAVAEAQPAGWANTRWGMTEQQIRELYPQAEPVRQKPNITSEQARLRVDNFQLDEKQFTLQFFFDSAGGLHELNLMQRADNTIDCINLSTSCDRLEELLNQKYGAPSLRKPQEQIERRHVVWNKPNMIVSFSYLESRTPVHCAIFITYKRPNSEALDHL